MTRITTGQRMAPLDPRPRNHIMPMLVSGQMSVENHRSTTGGWDYERSTRMLHSRGEDLADAAVVDNAQPGQLEVNLTRAAVEFLAERLTRFWTCGYVGFARQEQAPLSRDRRDAERFAPDGGGVRPALATSDHGCPVVPVTLTGNKSYYNIIVHAGLDGNVRAARRGLVRHGCRRRG